MTKELHMLSQDCRLDDSSAGPVVIRVSNGATPSDDQAPPDNQVGGATRPQLVFRALFKENRAASDWEQRLGERLVESGVKIGDEYYLVNRLVVEGLCEAAAYADEHEWLVMPADPELVKLAMQRGRARREANDAFDAWSKLSSTNSDQIRMNSYSQEIASDERRIRELRGQYVKPSFTNRYTDRESSKLDYAISQLNEKTRKRRAEVKRLREAIAENDLAFKIWQEAVKRVGDLDEQLAKYSPDSTE